MWCFYRITHQKRVAKINLDDLNRNPDGIQKYLCREVSSPTVKSACDCMVFV